MLPDETPMNLIHNSTRPKVSRKYFYNQKEYQLKKNLDYYLISLLKKKMKDNIETKNYSQFYYHSI